MDDRQGTRERTVTEDRAATEEGSTDPDDTDVGTEGRPSADTLAEARERYLGDDPAYDERTFDRDLERLADGADDLDLVEDAAETVWAALAAGDGSESGVETAAETETSTETAIEEETEPVSLARVGLVSSAALLWSLQTVFVPAALCVFVYALTFSLPLAVAVGGLWLVGSLVFSASLAIALLDGDLPRVGTDTPA